MDNTSLNQKSCVWRIPAGSLIHIAGLPYETVKETEAIGFTAPDFSLLKTKKNLKSDEQFNQPRLAADNKQVSCKLDMDCNGRYYLQAYTSDGEAILHKMLVDRAVVSVTPVAGACVATGVVSTTE
ncbi:hypothetical protein [Comamonas avium]|uniref:Uncharacterized protein n=1 Tax=Comamonas avium TaxID=2762231 RepID=A0ABR8SF49_9BURK|nr:hypothetical protein [Comamonas avium]MBD7962122.1 hypothetical protein [Comamonas avium]